MKLYNRFFHHLLNAIERGLRTKTFGDLRLTRYWNKINGKWDFVYYRSGVGRGDIWMAHQVFVSREYQIISQWHLRAMQAYARSKAGTPLIIDAGGNIGTSTFYFQKVFPNAFSYVIEPESQNFRVLSINLAGRTNVKLFEGAIGSKSGTAFLDRRKDCDHRIVQSGEETIHVIDTASILAEMEPMGAYPFLYKIDIEGSEHDLFSGDTSWLEKFPCMVIELHDWMMPFSGNSSHFLRAIAKGDWDIIPRGENLFCFNRRLLREFAKA